VLIHNLVKVRGQIRFFGAACRLWAASNKGGERLAAPGDSFVMFPHRHAFVIFFATHLVYLRFENSTQFRVAAIVNPAKASKLRSLRLIIADPAESAIAMVERIAIRRY